MKDIDEEVWAKNHLKLMALMIDGLCDAGYVIFRYLCAHCSFVAFSARPIKIALYCPCCGEWIEGEK